MTRKSYAKALDDALRPLGFARRGDDWIRVRGDMWECVHRHASWLGGVTVDLLQKDLATEKLFLEIFAAEGAIQMPPVDVRIGQLIGGVSRWWTKDELDGPADMAASVVDFGLPWFDKVRTLEQQAADWYNRKGALTVRGYHGGSLVKLALTLYRMGEREEACRILAKPVPRTAIPSSVADVARVRDWLGCPAPDPSSDR